MAFILRSNNTPPAKKADPKANNLMVKESTSVKVDKQIPLMSGREKEERRRAQMKERQGNLSTYKPQGALSKVMEIAGNPLTAFGYKARNEQLPDNFSKGTRNTLDSAVDIINPVSVAKEGYNAVKETGKGIYNATKGNFSEAGGNLASGVVSALSVLPAAKAARKLTKGVKVNFSKDTKLAENTVEMTISKGAPKISKPKPGTKLEAYETAIKEQDTDGLFTESGVRGSALSKIAEENVKKLGKKYSKSFSKKFGSVAAEDDLELYGRMQTASKGKKDPISSSNTSMNKLRYGGFAKDYSKASNDLAVKHGIATKYSEEEKVLNNAFSNKYDSRISQMPEDQVYLPDDHNASFYKKEVTPKMEKLVTKNKLKSKETFHRGDEDYKIQDVWREGKKLPKGSTPFSGLQVGDVWQPKKFISTTLDAKEAGMFGGIKSKIVAPKGQSVLVSNLVKGGGHFHEQEVVLPSKLKFKVEARTVKSGLDKDKGTARGFKHSIVNPYVASGAIGGSIMFNKNKK
jgi:hypothetical protein